MNFWDKVLFCFSGCMMLIYIVTGVVVLVVDPVFRDELKLYNGIAGGVCIALSLLMVGNIRPRGWM